MSSNQLRQRKKEEEKIENTSKNEEQQIETKVHEKTPMEIAQEKYRKFFIRNIWGLLMIGAFALILYSDHFLVAVFVILLQILVFKEMIGIRYIEAQELKLPGFRTLHWFFLFASFFFVYGSMMKQTLEKNPKLNPALTELLQKYHLAISFVLYIIGFTGFILTLRSGSLKYQFKQLTWTLMTLLLVVLQSHLIINNIFQGLIWFLLPSSLIICNDITAYLSGFFFGKKFFKQPLTSLSPNKTWEGFIGALFCTCVFAYFFSGFLSQYSWFICPKNFEDKDVFFTALNCTPDSTFVPTTYHLPPTLSNLLPIGISDFSFTASPIQLHALIFALFASLLAPFGGFFASGIKRAYGIKDFARIFPGHGGVTDRMDCQFLMGFFAYVYYETFINDPKMTIGILEYHLNQLPREEQLRIFLHLNQTLFGQ